MANTAFMTQYRNEYIAGFEQGQSFLRSCCTTEAVISGNAAVFLTIDSGAATATTRGVNSTIPARADNNNQYTATLVEWHDKVRKTGFNIFASQGNGRQAMQKTSMYVINRKIDADILGELANTTTTLNATAETASLSLVMRALAKLGNNFVPVEEEDNMFFVASLAFQAYLMQIKEFAHSEYVDVKPLVGPVRRMRRWAGFNWIFHPNISGKQTAAEKCYAFHRSAIGHAVNTGDMKVAAGYEEQDDYYWARTSVFMGSKILQNAGAVLVNHDGSAYA